MTYSEFEKELKKILDTWDYSSDDSTGNAWRKLNALYKKAPKNMIAKMVLMQYQVRAMTSENIILKSSWEGAKSEAEFQREQCKNLANALDGLRLIVARITAPQFRSKEKSTHGRIKLSEVLAGGMEK